MVEAHVFDEGVNYFVLFVAERAHDEALLVQASLLQLLELLNELFLCF